jgi:hypothetical protein
MRIFLFRGIEIESQGVIIAEQAVRPALKVTGTRRRWDGMRRSLRRKAFHPLAILMNGPLLTLRLN